MNDDLKMSGAQDYAASKLQAKLLAQIKPLSAAEACQQLGLLEGYSDRTMQNFVDAGQILGYELDGIAIYTSFQFDVQNQREVVLLFRTVSRLG